jgi:prepilin-type N-terminal cleavage/methylation domain-containing protein
LTSFAARVLLEGPRLERDFPRSERVMTIRNLTSRAQRDEAGFTILELMVCLAVLAALLTIVIPSVFSYESKTKDRVAQSDLRYALEAEKVFFIDGEQYTDSVPDLTSVEPGLTYAASVPPATTGVVGVSISNTSSPADTVVVSYKSGSGTCWYVKDVGVGPSAQTLFAKDLSCSSTPAFTASW